MLFWYFYAFKEISAFKSFPRIGLDCFGRVRFVSSKTRKVLQQPLRPSWPSGLIHLNFKLSLSPFGLFFRSRETTVSESVRFSIFRDLKVKPAWAIKISFTLCSNGQLRVFSSAVKMHRVAVISDKLWSRTLKSENRLISLNRLKYLVPKLPNSMRGCSLWQFRLYRKLAAWFPGFSIIRNLPRSCWQFKAFGWPIIIPSLFAKDEFLTVAVLKSHSKHKIISASDLWVFKFCRYSIASWQQQTF